MLPEIGKLSNLYASFIIETVGVLFSYWDSGRVCHFVNRAHLEWFGDPSGIGEHRNIDHLLFQLEHTTDQQLKAVLDGTPACFEKSYTALNGVSTPCRVDLIPHSDGGAVEGFIIQIIPLVRFHNGALENGKPVLANGNEQMEKVAQHLLNNLMGVFPGLEVLAATGFMSKSKLKRDFTHHFGMPPFFFFRYQQMRYAKSQIEQGRHNKKQLAEMLGFSNISNFYKCYKRYSS